MKINRDDLTLIVAHAMLTGIYNDTLDIMDPDSPEELDKFTDIGRRVGMAATAIAEGLGEWVEVEDSADSS